MLRELEVTISTISPELTVSFEPHVLTVGVKDVRIEDQSVLDTSTRIANIELGDGLQFVDGRLGVTPDANVVFVDITTSSGILSPEQLAAINADHINRLVYNNSYYYLASIVGSVRHYLTTDESKLYNEIQVDTETGEFVVVAITSAALAQHEADMVKHITAAERAAWNDKVRDVLAPDAEMGGDCYILQLVT